MPEVIQALTMDLIKSDEEGPGLGRYRSPHRRRDYPPGTAIDRDRVRLRTANPVHLSNYSTPQDGEAHTPVRSLLPDDPAFAAVLERNLNRRAENFGHTRTYPSQQITWIGPRRSFRVSGQGHSGQRGGAPVEIELTGNAGALGALWSGGIGQQTGAGFGWVSA